MKNTVFFGGTFDPPHFGHLMLAETVLRRGLGDQMWLAPAWIPPHKTDRKISSFEDRLEMTRLTILDNPELQVTDIERERKGLSYTVDTLDLLSERFPDRRFTLLIGGDSLATLHLWHNAEDLAGRYPIITWPRPGNPVEMTVLLQHWRPELAEKLYGGIIRNTPVTTVTSTKIRETIAKKGTSPFVKPQVLEYIIERRLYL